MDALSGFLDLVKKKGLAQGHFLGFLHVVIGRKITTSDGKPVSAGRVWRDLAAALKKARWDPEAARELGMNPDDLPPRDRQRFWYSVIARAGVDSAQAAKAGDKFAEVLPKHGFEVGPAPKNSGS